MVDYTAALHNNLLPFCEKEEAVFLLKSMGFSEIPAGATLYEEGDASDGFFILVSGRIAVKKQTGFSDRKQVVALLDPGAPLGEAGLLDFPARGATLIAVTDSSLISLSRQAFSEMVTVNPVLGVKILSWLMEKLTLRLRKSSERLALVL